MLLCPQRSPSALTDEILTLNITRNLPSPWLSCLYPWGIPTGHGHGVWPPEIPQILSWRGAVGVSHRAVLPPPALQPCPPALPFLGGHERKCEMTRTLVHAGSYRELCILIPLGSGRFSYLQRGDHLNWTPQYVRTSTGTPASALSPLWSIPYSAAKSHL